MTDETLFCDQPWGVLKDNIKNLNCSTSSWFAELSDKDAVRLKDMPCLIYKENDSQDKYDCYVFPPIKYPDGI